MVRIVRRVKSLLKFTITHQGYGQPHAKTFHGSELLMRQHHSQYRPFSNGIGVACASSTPYSRLPEAFHRSFLVMYQSPFSKI